MKISKNSWHYTLYTIGNAGLSYKDDFIVSQPTDLCSYIRNMVMGVIFSVIAVIMGVFVSLSLIDFPLSTLLFYITDNGLIPVTLPIFFLIGGIIYALGIFAFFMWSVNKLDIHMPQTIKKSETVDLIQAVFKSIKDKTCVLIEVKDE